MRGKCRRKSSLFAVTSRGSAKKKLTKHTYFFIDVSKSRREEAAYQLRQLNIIKMSILSVSIQMPFFLSLRLPNLPSFHLFSHDLSYFIQLYSIILGFSKL